MPRRRQRSNPPASALSALVRLLTPCLDEPRLPLSAARIRIRGHAGTRFNPTLTGVETYAVSILGIVLLAALLFIAFIAANDPAARVFLASLVTALAVLAVRMVAAMRRLQSRRRLQVQTLAGLVALSPAGFELAIADLLHDLGYRDVKRIGGSDDLAADIQCRNANGQRVIVQCKRYAPGVKVRSPMIQMFIGMLGIHHHAQRGIFVTTPEFTRPALVLARQHGITLWDGAEVARLFAKVKAGTADSDPGSI